MENIKIKPIEILDRNLTKLINKEIDNKELKKVLVEEYLSNNLSSSLINSLFSEETYVSLLDNKEKLTLLRGFNKYFEDLNLKEDEYFSNVVIQRIDNSIEVKEHEKITEIKLENFLEIEEDSVYMGVVSYEELYDYMKNGLLPYNLDLQREPTYIKMGNKHIPIPTLNQESIEDIIYYMKKNKLETNAITLGYLLKEDVVPEIKVTKKGEVLNRIEASSLLIGDGAHRIVSLLRYCSDLLMEGKQIPNRKLAVKVVIGDKSKIKSTIEQSFLQSNVVSKEYLSSITEDDYSKFIDKVMEQSDVLNENVASTFEECKYLNKITTREVLRRVVEYLDIQVNNRATVTFESKALAENLDVLIDLLKQNNCYLDYYNMYLPYMIFAYNIKKYNNDMNYYNKFMNKIKDVDVREFKLGLKNYSANKLIEYFDVFDEVVNDEE